MKKILTLIFTIGLFGINDIIAQDVNLPLSSYSDRLIDRMDIQGLQKNIFYTSIKNYSRKMIKDEILNQNIFDSTSNNKIDQFHFQYLKQEHFEISNSKPRTFKKRNFFNHFYKYPSTFYSVNQSDFLFKINPVLAFGMGSESSVQVINYRAFQNTRGLEVSGLINNKLGFYSFITENQISFNSLYSNYIVNRQTIPGEGFFKTGNKYHDFFQARGYITFSPQKNINFQFGHDKHFIGNGIRSMILSNTSKEYLFLKINTKVWKFNYQNLFAQLQHIDRISSSGHGIHNKYMANHYLVFTPKPNIQIGIFETVIFDRSDSLNKGQFDLNYLNPVIFYRSVEHNSNSADNMLIGCDFKWNLFKKYSIYTQFVLDEFVKNEFIKRTGWWANKNAFQLGIKAINMFKVKYLDLQMEYNQARPYTYLHFKKSQNLVHYNQPLAHILGTNFKEMLFKISYQPLAKCIFQFTTMYVLQGRDSSMFSKLTGSNILESYGNSQTRSSEYGNKIGQGSKKEYVHFVFNAQYHLYHNLFLDFNYMYRHNFKLYSPHFFNIGVRLNIAAQSSLL